MTDITSTTVCAKKVLDPVNLSNIRVLLDTILEGPGHLSMEESETREQWIERITDYASELDTELTPSSSR